MKSHGIGIKFIWSFWRWPVVIRSWFWSHFGYENQQGMVTRDGPIWYVILVRQASGERVEEV